MPRVPLEAYRRMTLAGSLAGVALFGAGLVALVQGQPGLAAVLLLAGVASALPTALLEIEGAPPMVPPSLLLYTRPDCSLCDEARARLEALRAEVPFDLWEADIRGDRELEARYGTVVPVGVAAGKEVFRLEVDEDRVKAALRA